MAIYIVYKLNGRGKRLDEVYGVYSTEENALAWKDHCSEHQDDPRTKSIFVIRKLELDAPPIPCGPVDDETLEFVKQKRREELTQSEVRRQQELDRLWKLKQMETAREDMRRRVKAVITDENLDVAYALVETIIAGMEPVLQEDARLIAVAEVGRRRAALERAKNALEELGRERIRARAEKFADDILLDPRRTGDHYAALEQALASSGEGPYFVEQVRLHVRTKYNYRPEDPYLMDNLRYYRVKAMYNRPIEE